MIKESRVPKIAIVVWDIIVKYLKALSDEEWDMSLAQDLFQIMASMKGTTLLACKRGLNPEKDGLGNERRRDP